jgi:hypothetical protein
MVAIHVSIADAGALAATLERRLQHLDRIVQQQSPSWDADARRMAAEYRPQLRRLLGATWKALPAVPPTARLPATVPAQPQQEVA